MIERAARLGAGAAVLGGSGALAACGSGDSGSGVSDSGVKATTTGAARAVKDGGELRVGMFGRATVFDPHRLADYPDFMVHYNVYDQGTRMAPGINAPLRHQLWLVESARPLNDDFTKYRLGVRPNVRFHDGQPLTADDMIFTLSRQLDPSAGFPNNGTLVTYFDGPSAFKKVDDMTVDVSLKSSQEYEDFLDILWWAHPIVPAGSPKRITRPNGTGPFKFVSLALNREVVLERNPDWWVNGEPHLDGARIVLFQDETAKHDAMLGGQIDVSGNITPADAKRLSNDSRFRIMRSPSVTSRVFYMDITKEPFDNPRVRRALKLAVDRRQLVANVLSGFGRIGNDLFDPFSWYYASSLPQTPYDPEQARALLKEAGFPNGIEVTLSFPSSEPLQALSAQVFQQQAKKSGITIKLDPHPDAAAFDQETGRNKYAFGTTSWASGPNYIFPQNDSGSYNQTNWSHKTQPEWWRLFDETAKLGRSPEAKANWLKLQERLVDDGPYIVWGFSDILDAMTTRVVGFQPSNSSFMLGSFYMNTWGVA